MTKAFGQSESDESKAPWDNVAEWAWHDSHVKAWRASDAAADAKVVVVVASSSSSSIVV